MEKQLDETHPEKTENKSGYQDLFVLWLDACVNIYLVLFQVLRTISSIFHCPGTSTDKSHCTANCYI